MHDPEADAVVIENRFEHAANGALLGPNLDADGLLIPEVAAILTANVICEVGGIIPTWYPFQLAILINNPMPRDQAFLAGSE